jgi:phosphoribosylglycinamide formyltransferase-1
VARLKVGVLVSGRGSNLQALLDACAAPDFPAEIALVISNRSDALALERARRAKVPTAVISHRDFETREAFDAAVDTALRGAGVEFVCLAGFMRILSTWFVERWRDRLINVHPSLLPAYRGLDTHARAIAAGEKFAGCTVHIVRPELDDGPIVLQAKVAIRPDDDADSLAERVLAEEHQIYPAALRLIGEGRVRIEANTVRIVPRR